MLYVCSQNKQKYNNIIFYRLAMQDSNAGAATVELLLADTAATDGLLPGAAGGGRITGLWLIFFTTCVRSFSISYNWLCVILLLPPLYTSALSLGGCFKGTFGWIFLMYVNY